MYQTSIKNYRINLITIDTCKSNTVEQKEKRNRYRFILVAIIYYRYCEVGEGLVFPALGYFHSQVNFLRAEKIYYLVFYVRELILKHRIISSNQHALSPLMPFHWNIILVFFLLQLPCNHAKNKHEERQDTILYCRGTWKRNNNKTYILSRYRQIKITTYYW